DTNIVLDILLRRSEWLADAEPIWQANLTGRLVACATASAMTDVFYVSRRLVGVARTRDAILVCLDTLTVLPVNQAVLLSAFARNGPDFEDDVQIACAEANGVDAIITRDFDGYIRSAISVLSPGQLRVHLGV
ncbi:MAG TPA: PIN domain-containing protein, partial [Pirellulales bacterium]|nr:PIN domain-containing protein [Pirellulales bacterium]